LATFTGFIIALQIAPELRVLYGPTRRLKVPQSQLHRDRTITTKAARAILTEHLDGIRVPLTEHRSRGWMIRLMIYRGQLKEDGTATVITDEGRWVLAELLGDSADAMEQWP
jgi:hypothetical protein